MKRPHPVRWCKIRCRARRYAHLKEDYDIDKWLTQIRGD